MPYLVPPGCATALLRGEQQIKNFRQRYKLQSVNLVVYHKQINIVVYVLVLAGDEVGNDFRGSFGAAGTTKFGTIGSTTELGQAAGTWLTIVSLWNVSFAPLT